MEVEANSALPRAKTHLLSSREFGTLEMDIVARPYQQIRSEMGAAIDKIQQAFWAVRPESKLDTLRQSSSVSV